MPCQRRALSLPLSLLLCLLFVSENVLGAILAVDYGTEWTKASLIKPGVPFDVLLDRDSKRKIHSTVAWKADDRLFGSDAFNIAARFPGDSFSFLKNIQGVQFESEKVSFQKSISGVELVPSSRGTVNLQRADANHTVWSVEELIAMQFAYVKELAESVTGEGPGTVRDVVVAIPPYLTQFERDAVVDAVEIAGLKLVALVHDGTAIALNYAMTRTFPTPEWHVIYDAGAGGIRATVVGLSTTTSESKSGKGGDATQLTVAGVGFDRGAGGLEIDRRIRDLLVDEFEKQHGRSIRGDRRGMAKLLKEAGRIKAILSANTEAISTLESVAFDLDLRTRLSRATLESICEDLKTRFAAPVRIALAKAGLGLDNITSVILAGGHSRVPMVQAALKAAVGEPKIATSVNADEAAVLGAALYGASVSRQFRTKDFRVSDILPYEVQVSYKSEPKYAPGSQDGEQVPLRDGKIINALVFAAGSKLGSKKLLALKRKDDFTMVMGYRGSVGQGIPTELVEATVTGVKEAVANLTELGTSEPVIKINVVITESGFVGIQDAFAYVDPKKEDETIAGKIKGFFGGSGKEETADGADAPVDNENDEAGETATSASSSASAAPVPNKKSTKDVGDSNKVPLKVTLTPLSIPALKPVEIREARDRLRAVDAAEAAKRKLEETRNNLESYLYRLRDLLDSDEENPFIRCSQESERKAIRQKLEDTMLWMHEHADEATIIDLWDRKNALDELEKPIQFRYKEIEEFPVVLNNSQKVNFLTRLFLVEARQNVTEEAAEGLPSKWTISELDALEKSLKEHEAWLNEWVEKQKAVKFNEDPVILTTEMKARAKTLQNQAQRLSNRKSPPKPKKTTSSSTSTSTTSSSAEETQVDEETETVRTVTVQSTVTATTIATTFETVETVETTTVTMGTHDEL